MNKKLKRYLAGLMTVMTMSTLSGCNMKLFDTTYGFENAVVLNDGNSVVIPLSKCKKDYKGESVQLITNDNMETSMPGVFAAGDIRVKAARQVATAVGDGVVAGIAVTDYLTE